MKFASNSSCFLFFWTTFTPNMFIVESISTNGQERNSPYILWRVLVVIQALPIFWGPNKNEMKMRQFPIPKGTTIMSLQFGAPSFARGPFNRNKLFMWEFFSSYRARSQRWETREDGVSGPKFQVAGVEKC